MDRAWWEKYIREVRRSFKGLRYTAVGSCYDVAMSSVHHYKNSGAAAINLAASFGAKKIILLGYDCQHTGGKAHWHSDHPKGLANAGKVATWPAQFNKLAQALVGVEVVNCSRQTALTCWPREELENILCAL